jgi:hypothetical protein
MRSILRDCVLSDRYSLPSGASFVSDRQGPVPLCHLSNRGASLPKSEHQYSRTARARPSLGSAPQTCNYANPQRARPGRGPRFVSIPLHPQKAGVKPTPLKFSISLPQISRLQYFFPAYRPLPKPRSLALRRFVRAPATEHHLAEVAHWSRDRRRHALELGLRSLLFAQPGFADLPRRSVRPA